jgi:hypothetical protein
MPARCGQAQALATLARRSFLASQRRQTSPATLTHISTHGPFLLACPPLPSPRPPMHVCRSSSDSALAFALALIVGWRAGMQCLRAAPSGLTTTLSIRVLFGATHGNHGRRAERGPASVVACTKGGEGGACTALSSPLDQCSASSEAGLFTVLWCMHRCTRGIATECKTSMCRRRVVVCVPHLPPDPLS